LVESYFENPVGEMCAVLYVKFKEFTMLLLKDKVIWVLTPYRLVNIDGRFQGSWCLNLQSQPGKGGGGASDPVGGLETKWCRDSRIWGSGVPKNFVGGGGSTNSVEDRGQREQGSGGGSPLEILEAAVIWYKKFHFI